MNEKMNEDCISDGSCVPILGCVADSKGRASKEGEQAETQASRYTERAAMSAVGKTKGVLELFKFGCYVSIPIVMMVVFANTPQNLEKIIRNRSYVVYPPEGPRPPSGDEIREMIKNNKATP